MIVNLHIHTFPASTGW